MIDRRLLFVSAIVFALLVLSLIGLPPKVLWQKVQEFTSGAGGAANATLRQAETRGKQYDEAGQILDALPSEKKDSWTERKKRNQR
ncbi:MAG: hypothetical protein H7145_04080 [Akkermansiaceae bacterium]|nr:hypothetical protein [Armatimonadota bacterium]